MVLLDRNRVLSIAVIGVGRMGSRHAQVVARLRDRGVRVTLAGVADRHIERARSVAAATQTIGVDDYRELFYSADATIVAVPPHDHFGVVRDSLRAGLDVLVEKPFCSTLAQAAELCQIARSRRRLLQVGHLEWFNPAWHAAAALPQRPWMFDARRMGPSFHHRADVDVVYDLMIHDLHLIQAVVAEEPSEVFGDGTVEFARATLIFPSGCVARLTASRVSSTRTRLCRIYRTTSMATVDFVEQSVSLIDQNGVRALTVVQEDVLEAQLMAFLTATRSRWAGAVEGRAVLPTMQTAERIAKSLRISTNQPLSNHLMPFASSAR
jgi:predicted dehydrogenase